MDIKVSSADVETCVNSFDVLAKSRSVNISQVPNDLEIPVRKKEYSIVGDSLYASINADEAPTWLTSIVDSVVSNTVDTALGDYDLLVQDVRNAIDSIDVAKNTFVQSINIASIVDGIVATELNTLNASIENSYATKVDLTSAIATLDSASVQRIQDLSVSFNNEIDSRVTEIQTAIASGQAATATSIQALTSSFINQEQSLAGTADAVSGLRTYVGLGPSGAPDGQGILGAVNTLEDFYADLDSDIKDNAESIVSLSDFFVSLSNEVESTDGKIASAAADLEVFSAAYTDQETQKVQNKFSYNSVVSLNGQNYSTGFGLNTVGLTQNSSADGSENNPFTSEFWVNAKNFVIIDPDNPSSRATFKIKDGSLQLGVEHTEATRNIPKGTYLVTGTYQQGDTVTYNGASYVAKKTTQGNTPQEDNEYWQVLSKRGVDGVAGSPGQDGVDGKSGLYVSYIFRNAVNKPSRPVGGSYGVDGVETYPNGWTDEPDTFTYPTRRWMSVAKYDYNASLDAWVILTDWSEPSLQAESGKDGVDGIEGESGLYVSFIYRNAENRPSTPAGGSYSTDGTEVYPSGWTDNPTDFSLPQKRWVSTAKYAYSTQSGSWVFASTWSTPALQAEIGENGLPGAPGSKGDKGDTGDRGITGPRGANGENPPYIEVVYRLGQTAPSKPSGGFYSRDNENGIPSGWSRTAQTVAYPTKRWRSQATYYYIEELGIYDRFGSWSDPVIDADAGSPGAGFYRYGAASGSWPGNTVATNYFVALSGRAPAIDDILTVYKTTDITDNSTRRFNGTSWQNAALVIDGDLIAQGTIAANRIAATELSALTADLGTVTAGVLRNNDGTFVIDLNNGTITISV